MPSSAQPLRLGPFLGGLNTASDPTAIADAELVTCHNFELDIDGSLVSRPPFKEIEGPGGITERLVVLCDAIFSGTHYLIFSNSNGVYHWNGTTWGLVTASIQSYAAVQYADKVYIVAEPGAANPGGKWDPVGGFVAVAAIPKGMACVIHKERLFIAPGVNSITNASRLAFSDPGNFDTWPGANFLDVSQGDGTNLVDLTVYQDNVLLFKNYSTYVLAYDIRPTDAVLRKISSTIGVSKQYCVLNYENQVYVINHEGWVYEIISYDFNRINTKVPFIRDFTAPTSFADESLFLGLLGDRLICRFFRNVYVYGLRTRTWSEWESTEDVLHYFGPIVKMRMSTGDEYYCGSALTANRNIIRLYDKQSGSTYEEVLDPTITYSDDFNEITSNGWGNLGTGQAWINSGGANSEYSKNGTKGVMSQTSVAVTRQCHVGTVTMVNPDQTVTFSVPVIATGASIGTEIRARVQGNGDRYRVRFAFSTGSTMTYTISKIVGGVGTDLVGPISFGAYSANEEFTARFQLTGSTIKLRIWRTLSTPPVGWTATTTDSSITTTGEFGVLSLLFTGNTNTLPVAISFDNYQVGNIADVIRDIECSVKTKNFDMAISHQFKRLWWWGADVSSNRDITGIATPIVANQSVTWGQLSAVTWGSISSNPWGSPLTQAFSIETVLSTGTGSARRFAKFLKGLRYRQINFEVRLLTNGTTSDGPARLFTMLIITESKQVVPKGVN